MMPHVGGVSHVRVVNPLRALVGQPGLSVQILTDATFPDLPPGTEGICILHRAILAGEPGLDVIRELLAKGYIIVSEFDDNPDVFQAMQGPDVFAFRAVHAVQTSTEPLADILRPKNPEIAIFPNAMPTLPAIRNFTDPRRRTLFFGALNRTQDWAPLLQALNAAAASLGDRLGFSIVHDRLLFDSLETPYKAFVPTCDYETYLRLLGESEIAFMPLADTAFNHAKSDLKFVEAGACRVAALASPVVYGATIEDGRTGLLFRTPQELLHRLAWLVVNPDAVTLADAGRVWVAEHRMLADQTQARIGWYQMLVTRRAALTAALLARVPELATPRPGFVAMPGAAQEAGPSAVDTGRPTAMSDSGSLGAIAIKHGSVKWGAHGYTRNYEKQFSPFRDKKINILELGVSGYEDPTTDGASLRMWRDYFPKAQIFSVDFVNKDYRETDRIRIYQGSRDDGKLLRSMSDDAGGFDIVIDNVNHQHEHGVATFNMVFPLLKNGGLYVVADARISYWPKFGGSISGFEPTQSTVGFFTELMHGLNHAEVASEAYQNSLLYAEINSIHIYRNAIFVEKNNDIEETNGLRTHPARQPANAAVSEPNDFAWLADILRTHATGIPRPVAGDVRRRTRRRAGASRHQCRRASPPRRNG